MKNENKPVQEERKKFKPWAAYTLFTAILIVIVLVIVLLVQQAPSTGEVAKPVVVGEKVLINKVDPGAEVKKPMTLIELKAYVLALEWKLKNGELPLVTVPMEDGTTKTLSATGAFLNEIININTILINNGLMNKPNVK